jgi:hypothetical protein
MTMGTQGLLERAVHRIAVDIQANGWISRPGKRRMRARRWGGGGSVGGREPVTAQRYDAAGPGSGGAVSHEGRPAGRGKRQRERGGDGTEGKKERDDGGYRGAASFLYSSQAARRCHARSGGAKPEQAAHRNLDYVRSIPRAGGNGPLLACQDK